MLVFCPASGKDEAKIDAKCDNTSERLQADDLERFGIGFRAEQAAGVYHMTLRLQPSICIQTSGSDCGTTTFEFDRIRLAVGGDISTLKTVEPNDYEYRSQFKIAGNRLDEAELRLMYRGNRCAAARRARHTFIVNLRNAVDSSPDFFF